MVNNHIFLKLNRSVIALGFMMLFLWMFSFQSLAGKNDDSYKGIEDYLENTDDKNIFGASIQEAETKLNKAKEADKYLNEINDIVNKAYLDEVKETGRISVNFKLKTDDLPDDLKALLVDEGKYLRIPVPEDVDAKKKGYVDLCADYIDPAGWFDARVNASTKVEKYIDEQEQMLRDLRAIYGSFSIVGSGGSGGTGGITVGRINATTILEKLYNKASTMYSTPEGYYKAEDEEKAPGTFEKAIAQPIGNGAFNLYRWMMHWNIDVTMDGLVFGRLSPTYRGTVDFTHFGMEPNNPYGIVAASAYYVLRRIFLGVLPVIMMAILLRQLFYNGQKGRAMLKEALSNFVWVIALSFVAPYLIEICILIRDGVLKYTSLGMGAILDAAGIGNGMGSSIIGLIYPTYKKTPSLLNALIWAASVGSGFFYLATYIQIAMLLTGCVAILPIVLFISIWNSKILKDWWNVFFPNLCVPLIDLILLQLPMVLLLVFKKNIVDKGGHMILGIIIIIVMWNSLMIRDRVVKLLGFEGFARHSGVMIAAAAAAIQTIARSIRRAEGRRASDEIHDKNQNVDWDAERKLSEERGKLRDEALKNVGKKVCDVEPEYDSSLRASTDEYLKQLDETYNSDHPKDSSDIEDVGDKEKISDNKELGEISENSLTSETDSVVPEISETDSGSEEAGRFEEQKIDDDIDKLSNTENVSTAEMPAGLSDDLYTDGEPFHKSDVQGEELQNILNGDAEGGQNQEHPEQADGTQNGATAGSGDGSRDSADQTSNLPKAEEYMQSSAYPERKPYLEEISPEQDAFRNELSGAAKDRYDNLAKIDAYNDKIRQNEEIMQKYGYSKNTYEHDRAEFMVQENRLNAHMNESRAKIDRMNQIGDMSSKERLKEEENYRGMQQAKEALHERVAQLDRASGLDKANNIYRGEIAEMTKNEKEYAKAWEIGGMSGRTYQDAKDFRFQTKVDQAQKSLASYKNFDSRRFEGILTPEERESFYKEREIREKREKAVQIISTGGRYIANGAVLAATVTAAAAGATFSAYGGSQTMRDAGTVTGAIGNVAARSVVKIGGLAGRIGGRAYVESPVNISKSKKEKAGGMVNAGVAREVPKKGETPRQTSGMGETSNQSSRKSSASNQGPKKSGASNQGLKKSEASSQSPKKSGASNQGPKKSGASNQSPKMNGASNQEPRKKEASRQEPKKKEVSNKKTNSVSSQNAGKKAEYRKIQNSQGKKRSGSRSTSQKPKGRASGKTKKKASSAKKKSKK